MTQLPSNPEPEFLQIPAWLVRALKQGEIHIQTNGAESVQLRVENRKLDLNFLQKDPIKTLLELEAKTKIEETSILERLTALKNMAEALKREGFTMTISYRAQTLLTLGAEAKPTISQMVSGTNAIEVNNLIELMKLML